MTKKFIVLISIILFAYPLFSFYSDITKVQGRRQIDILAQKGDYNMLSISTPDSGALASGSYMPFYLTDPYVQYTGDVNEGRHIADWTLATNYTPVKLIISADDLKASTSLSGKKDTIPYILGFYYNYPEIINGAATGKTISGTIVVNSGTVYNSELDDNCDFNDVLAGGAITFSNAPIRFMLAEGVDVNDGSYVTDTYSAKVTVTISGE